MSTDQTPMLLLEREIPKIFVRRMAIALSISSTLALAAALAWTFFQRQAIEHQTRESLAASLSEPIRSRDLISIKRIMKAFELANPKATMCVRLSDLVEITPQNCIQSEFFTFSVPLTGETYAIAVSAPLPMLSLLIGVVLFLASTVVLLYAQTSAKRFTSALLDDLRILAMPTLSTAPRFSEFRDAREKIDQVQSQQALLALGAQVSHDIRSPLSALNMVIGTLEGLPEEKRLLVRNAVQRINDIANGLLQKGKRASEKSPTASVAVKLAATDEPVLLVALLDSIVSEKRMQFREKMHVEIQGDLNSGYGLFANIDSTEFARVISNLVNNAIESFSKSGKVLIKICSELDNVIVVVSDNGKGIPPEVLSKLGERGFSHGKENSDGGSGLGLYHAKQTIFSAGGKILIDSQLGKGTSVQVSLPRAQTPNWFVESITLSDGRAVVSVDDDQTIHQIWAERLGRDTQHFAFSSIEDFVLWMSDEKTATHLDKLFLVDFEFLGQQSSGLELIQQLGIGQCSILVSSHYEEPAVKSRAASLGVKILPKALAPFVPIHNRMIPSASASNRKRFREKSISSDQSFGWWSE